jgi:hypothetical protein
MIKQKTDRIIVFIKSQSGNKVVFHTQDITHLESVNIGERISESIYHFKEPSRIAMQVSSVLSDLLNASISNHDMFGSYLAIENLGILFEPELKVDFARLLENYSQNNLLFVKWDGEIDANYLYFLTKEDGIKVNIKNLSHIKL